MNKRIYGNMGNWCRNVGSSQDSPVERARKRLPQGDGNWPGFDTVYTRLSAAANKIAQTDLCLSDEHVILMAIMGSGHEETMKGEMHRLMGRGFIKL